MAIKGYCGGECGCTDKCNTCALDMSIPCSPNCENLTSSGMIKVAKCLEEGCEEVKHIFNALNKTDNEIIKEYGEVALYPGI